ncbi:MAG TPA: hypothetical protein VF666_09000 [Pyrinomonadaceae bacterium]|jgi:hypothetical protein
MLRRIVVGMLVVLLSVATVGGVEREPPRDVLGVYPGMSEAQARRRLDRAGRQQVAERLKQSVWEVKDRRISHVVVRFSNNHVVRWVTALARTDAERRLRYADVGDTSRAEYKTDGRNHTYIWTIPSRRGRSGYVVVAGGSDPQFLTSYRLSRTFE